MTHYIGRETNLKACCSVLSLCYLDRTASRERSCQALFDRKAVIDYDSPWNRGNLMSSVATTHIEIDDRGVAWITDANTKVIEVVLDRVAYGWSPEEIHFQHPTLSLAQIHAALTYYYDHQAELDAEIVRQLKEVEALAEAAKDSPGRRPCVNAF